MTPSRIKIPHRFSSIGYCFFPGMNPWCPGLHTTLKSFEPFKLCVNLDTQGKNWQSGKILTLQATIGILGKFGHSQLKIGKSGGSGQKSALWIHLLK